MSWLFFIAAAFLLGSIPTGLLIARARGIDIRQHGSRNIGATNVGRVLGRRWGALCFILDVAKGAVPTLAAGAWHGVTMSPAAAMHTTAYRADAAASALTASTASLWLAVMAAAILGHMFSPWIRFKGGKGVATGLGSLLAVFPYLTVPALAALAVWLVVVRLSRMVGISSCIAALTLPVSTLAWMRVISGGRDEVNTPPLIVFVSVTTLLAALVIYKHRANLVRTWAGTEPKIGRRQTPTTQPEAQTATHCKTGR